MCAKFKNLLKKWFFYKNPNTLIKAAMFLFSSLVTMSAQNYQQVSGSVYDMTGQPLIGVNVIVKGTTKGVITDVDGKFSLQNLSPKDTLLFSMIGFQKKWVMVGNNTVLNLILEEDNKVLSEYVVVGFGVQKKADVIGAVSVVDANDMVKVSSSTVGGALQGRAAGVNVIKSSGAPGADSKINIRGITSLNNTDPLIVVDGVRIGTGALERAVNVEDIESLSVLKDAAAAAIYGKDAANGVILVTTKRGTSKDANISFHAFASSDQIYRFPELLNANQYRDVLVQSAKNDGVSETLINTKYKYYLKDWDQSTNWADHVLRNGVTQNYNLSASGGNEKFNYYMSGTYTKQDGVVIATDHEKFSYRLNMDAKLRKWLKVGQSITFNYQNSTPLDNEKGVRNTIYVGIFRANPTVPVYDETNIAGGGYGYMNDPTNTNGWAGPNPVALLNQFDGFDKSNYLYGNVYAEIDVLKSLKWRTNIGGTFTWSKSEELFLPVYHSRVNNDKNNYYYYSQGQSNKFDIVSYLSYNKTFGATNIEAVAGTEFTNGGSTALKTSVSNLIDVDKRNIGLILDPLTRSVTQNIGHYGQYGFFGRAQVNVKDRYMAQFNVRKDYSDKFGTNYESGVFPSFSAGWRVSEESFFNIDWINSLKLRAGWGILGSDNIARYRFLMSYSDFGYATVNGELVQGSQIAVPANNDIRWESNEQSNIGIDFSLMKNKLFGSLEYYLKNSYDILINQPLPTSTGFQNIQSNLAETRNSGVDFNLNYRDKVGKLGYSITANLNYNKNEVLSLNSSLAGINGGQVQNMTVSRTQPGYAQASFYGFIADGLFQSQEEIDALNALTPEANVYYQKQKTAPGDIKYRDIASLDEKGNRVMIPDGKITDADKDFLGSPWPKFSYSLNVALDYKGFDLTMYFTAVSGVELYNMNKQYTDRLFGDYNASTNALNAWTPENTNTTIPRLTLSDPNQNFAAPSSYFIEDGSYIRLKNLILGYSLPKNLLTKIGFSTIRIYASTSNPFTFTKYTGVDPEFTTSGSNLVAGVDEFKNYPQYRSYNAGIQINF